MMLRISILLSFLALASFAQSCCTQGSCLAGDSICGWGVGYTSYSTCNYGSGGCPFGYYLGGGECCCQYTPILINLADDEIKLSSAEDGVLFRISGVREDSLMRVAWPERGTQTAWLVLDRNGNGAVDDASELFGNVTPAPVGYVPPPGTPKNGFTVLAVFDKQQYGGNANGVIDPGDSIFERLRLWLDRNRNGRSEPDEFIKLADAGILAIELDYRESKKTDSHGNEFRWRAKIRRGQDSGVDRWAWDVVLKVVPPSSPLPSSPSQ